MKRKNNALSETKRYEYLPREKSTLRTTESIIWRKGL